MKGGGAEQVCVNLANRLSNKGWSISIVTLHLKDSPLLEDLSEHIKVINLNTLYVRSSFFCLRKIFVKEKARKVLVFTPELAVLAILVNYSLFKQAKIAVRNINTLSKKIANKESFWYRSVIGSLISFFYQFTDLIIAQSKGMRDDLVSEFSIPVEKIVVINNPLKPIIENKLKENKSLIKQNNYILYVGRLEKIKRVDQIIKAFKVIYSDFTELHLKIVGIGSMKSSLESLSVDLEIKDRVHFEGYQKNISPYYEQALVTLLTSEYEGFPNVLIESIAHGTPVVSYNCPSGPEEIIIDGVNGYLVEHNNFNGLVKALQRILEMKISRNKVKKTAEKYLSENIIADYEQSLLKI